jgi:protease IV
MRVFRWIFRLIVGLFALVGIAVVAMIVLVVFALADLSTVRQLPQRVTLYLDTGDGVIEARPDNPFAFAATGDAIALAELVQGLEAAAKDARVQGLLVRLGSGELGFAQAQEMRDAVLAFRKSGKFAVAFAETFGEAGSGNVHYYLATAFDEIWMQPSGEVGLTGTLVEMPFVRETLDMLGVVPRIDQRKEYKSAADTFTEREMPQPVRENLQRLADSLTEQIAAGIAQGREMTAEQARALIDKGPFLAVDAQQQRLVSKLGYWDEVRTSVRDRAPADTEEVALTDYVSGLPKPPEDAPTIALVYGVGPVQLTNEEEEPFFGSLVMDLKVAKAIADALADETVEAIVFRVDSPGGSYVASDAIWREVDRARRQGKPVIVSMADTAASGGYFVAAPAKAIVAQPGTITGSIGVLGGKFVVDGLFQQLGINWDGVQSGRHAGYLSPNRDFSQEEWASLQVSLDRIYLDFKSKVAEGRAMPADQVEAAAQGQVWSGADAKARGLVDQLGGYAAAIALARQAAGIAPDAAIQLVRYPRVDDQFARFLGWLADEELVSNATLSSLAASGRLAGIEAALGRWLEPVRGLQSTEPQLRAPTVEVR